MLTVAVQVDEFPSESVNVAVIVLSPKLEQSNVSKSKVAVVSSPQLSGNPSA